MEKEFMILKRSLQDLLSTTGEVQESCCDNFRENSDPQVMKKFSVDQLVQLYSVYDKLYNKEKHSGLYLKVTLECFMRTFWDCVQAKMEGQKTAGVFINAFHGYCDGVKDLVILRFLKHWAGLPDKCIGKEFQFFGFSKCNNSQVFGFQGKVNRLNVNSSFIMIQVLDNQAHPLEVHYWFNLNCWVCRMTDSEYLGQIKVLD